MGRSKAKGRVPTYVYLPQEVVVAMREVANRRGITMNSFVVSLCNRWYEAYLKRTEGKTENG